MSPTPIPRLPGPGPGDLVVSHDGTIYRVTKEGWRKEPWENLTSQEQESVDHQSRLRRVREKRKG